MPLEVKAFEDFSATKKPIASWHNKNRTFGGISLQDICIRYGFFIKKGKTILFQFLSFKNLTFISVFGFRGAGHWSVLLTL